VPRHGLTQRDAQRHQHNQIAHVPITRHDGPQRLGRSVSLAAPVEDWVTPGNPDPARHQMKEPLGTQAGRGLSFGMDRIAMNIHGNVDSHIDALCHVSFDGARYNGVPAGVVTEAGATELSIAVAADGIVGRGLLLDVPRSRGVPWLEPGDHVTVDDLLAAEHDPAGADGQRRHRAGAGGAPSADELTGVCERTGKWSFLCVIAPLRLPTGTGSPVNPIAVL
jgi:Putative cyclase